MQRLGLTLLACTLVLGGQLLRVQSDFLQGLVATVKDFGPEAEQEVNGTAAPDSISDPQRDRP